MVHEDLAGRSVKRLKNGGVHTYLDGRLHSFDDKPSMTREQGIKVWHINGYKDRAGDKPAFIKKYHYSNNYKYSWSNKESQWFVKGKLHRDADKPAIVSIFTRENNSSKTVTSTKEWYRNGKRHRVSDKPAVVIITKTYGKTDKLIERVTARKFYFQGKLHRENDKPSVRSTRRDYKNGKMIAEESLSEFHVKGKSHRDGDKPAKRFIKTENNTVIIKKEEYLVKGFHHRDNSNKPAYIEIKATPEGKISSRQFKHYSKGNLHRMNDKPAYSREDLNNSGETVLLEEKYLIKGKLHRDGDKPAYVFTAPYVSLFGYLKEDKFDRNDYPAIFLYEKNEKISFQHYLKGIKVENVNSLFVKEELVKLDKTFLTENTEDYPLSQLLSILNALSDNKYSTQIHLKDIDRIYNHDLLF